MQLKPRVRYPPTHTANIIILDSKKNGPMLMQIKSNHSTFLTIYAIE